jgi:hypothetical protein
MQYFDDDGTEIHPDLIPTPDLCVTCARNGDPEYEMLCSLTRIAEPGEEVFLCFAYQPASPDIDREAVIRELCDRAGVEYVEDPADEDSEPINF